MIYTKMFWNNLNGMLDILFGNTQLLRKFTDDEKEFLSNEANVEILNLINDLNVFLDEINCLKLDEILQINSGCDKYAKILKNEENGGLNIENLIKLTKDYIDLYPRIKNDKEGSYRIMAKDDLNIFKEKLISYLYFLCKESDKEALGEKLDTYNKKVLDLCANADAIFLTLEENYIKTNDLESFVKDYEKEIKFLNDFILQFIFLFEDFSRANYLYFKDSTPRERIRNYNKFFNEVFENLDHLNYENNYQEAKDEIINEANSENI